MSIYSPTVLYSFSWITTVGIIAVASIIVLVTMSPAFKK